MSSWRLRADVGRVNREFIDSPQDSFSVPFHRVHDLPFPSRSMRHFRYRSAALSIFVGLVVCVGEIGGGRAGEAHSFLIAANDGYGVQDCLGEGGECGRVVADAWCEAHGHGAALAFGRADDGAGAIRIAAPAATPANDAGPYVVTCGD